MGKAGEFLQNYRLELHFFDVGDQLPQPRSINGDFYKLAVDLSTGKIYAATELYEIEADGKKRGIVTSNGFGTNKAEAQKPILQIAASHFFIFADSGGRYNVSPELIEALRNAAEGREPGINIHPDAVKLLQDFYGASDDYFGHEDRYMQLRGSAIANSKELYNKPAQPTLAKTPLPIAALGLKKEGR